MSHNTVDVSFCQLKKMDVICTGFQPNQLSCRLFVKIGKFLNIMGCEELHFGPKFEFSFCVFWILIYSFALRK